MNTAGYLPLICISVAMIVAAVIDGVKLKVPNWLTFPIIFSGWVLGAFYDLTSPPEPLLPTLAYSDSRFVASLAVTCFGFAIFVPIYAIGGVGAGDVKMQMGYGAWIGAFCGLYPGMLGLLLGGHLLGIVVGGVLALGMMLVLRQFGEYAQNTREILLDLATSGGRISKVADKAAHSDNAPDAAALRHPPLYWIPWYWLYLPSASARDPQVRIANKYVPLLPFRLRLSAECSVASREAAKRKGPEPIFVVPYPHSAVTTRKVRVTGTGEIV